MPQETDPPGRPGSPVEDWGFPPVLPAAVSVLPAAPAWLPEARDELRMAPEFEEPPSTGVLPVPRRVPTPGPPVSPLRALAGAAVAVAGVLLGIGALLWATDAPKGAPTLQQAQGSDAASLPSPKPSPRPTPETITLSPAPATTQAVLAPLPAAAPRLALTVLNNSNVTGLAKRSAARYQAAGWPIKLTGSFRGRIPVTTAYYPPEQQASALRLQREFPAIERVRPRFEGLPGSGLTVVLTRDYPG
ncbi:MAG: LytR C-terminal domain-containing protein [Frankiaceae bacterium]|nr:LytR C-terminal domain-containing protein [Frankiaceae bacterium]